MSIGTLTLDDRRFQDLVNEARTRVAHRCPEWTEHNVSDPGITLIETFAWMTDMLVYRLNRVPEKLHGALLELLGIELDPPSAAQAEVLFRLASPAERPVHIPGHTTEVTAAGAVGEEPVVFRVRDDFEIQPLRPTAVVLQRAGVLTSLPVAEGTARPSGTERLMFSTPPVVGIDSATPPVVGDALYLGFSRPLDRLVMRIEVEGSRARGVGVDPKDPPLRWEVPDVAGWRAVKVLEDTTRGFNEEGGAIELQLPERTIAAAFAGRQLYWLRCRVVPLTAAGLPSPRYTHPPRIESITARPVGALVRTEHALTEVGEVLGESDGTPGQTFRLRRAPVLELREVEHLEVLEPGAEEWAAWTQRESFDDSDPDDRHFRFDAARGEVQLGPAIRSRNAGWRQHGAVPPKGARLRMTRYRHGGGRVGAVASNTLRQLRNPIAGVNSVTNPEAAWGGVDAESIEVARRRAALELRSRWRAVTAEDFEFLADEGPVSVARARCVAQPGSAVSVYVLPTVADPARRLGLEELTPSGEFLASVAEFLDERRLVGTKLVVKPVRLRGVTVVADVVIAPGSDARVVEQDVKDALYRFVNPIVGGTVQGQGKGWPFGRPLEEGELHGLVGRVRGVERVSMVRMYATDMRTPLSPRPTPAGSHIDLAAGELPCSAAHRVRTRVSDDDRD